MFLERRKVFRLPEIRQQDQQANKHPLQLRHGQRVGEGEEHFEIEAQWRQMKNWQVSKGPSNNQEHHHIHIYVQGSKL